MAEVALHVPKHTPDADGGEQSEAADRTPVSQTVVSHIISDGAAVDPEQVVTSIIHVKLPKDSSTMDEFWQEALPVISQFEGFLKRDMLSGEQPDGSMHYTIILTFTNYRTLRAWLMSIEREELVARYNLQASQVRIPQPSDVVEIEGMISAPRKPVSARPAPKWKLFLITWPVVWLAVWWWAESGLGNFVSENVRESFSVSTFIAMCVLVPPVSFAITPVVTYVLQHWLSKPRPIYKWEPMKTLDEGCSLFLPPPPPVDPEQVAALTDRLNHLEAALRKMISKGKGEDHLGAHDTSWARQHSHGSSGTIRSRTTPVVPAVDKLKLDLEKGVESKRELAPGEQVLPVTGVGHHHVKWEYEAEFIQACQQFRELQKKKFPGFLGMTTLHGKSDGLGYSQEYVNIWRYQTYEDMERQVTSPERAEFLNTLKPMLEKRSEIQFNQERHIMDALTETFVNPGEAAQATPPPLWKTTILSIVALMMCVWPVNQNFGPVLEDWGVEELYQQTLILSGINVFLNSYVCVPFVILVFGGWLNRQRRSGGGTILTNFLDRGFPYLWMKVVSSIVFLGTLLTLAIVKPKAFE